MADTDNDAESTSEQSGNTRLLIIFAAVALLLIAGSVGGTLYFLGFFSPSEEELSVEADVAPEVVRLPAIYFALNPKFTTNYEKRGRQRLFQVGISLVTRDQTVVDALGKHVPAIKNKLVILLSGQDFEALQTPEGREQLRTESLAAVQSIMQAEIGVPGVEKVLFTDFVMQ